MVVLSFLLQLDLKSSARDRAIVKREEALARLQVRPLPAARPPRCNPSQGLLSTCTGAGELALSRTVYSAARAGRRPEHPDPGARLGCRGRP